MDLKLIILLLLQVILCHCNDCKRYTGSGFSANIFVPKANLVWTSGTPKLYLTNSNRGFKTRRQFCGDCGTPFTSQAEDEPDAIVIKSGTLDDEHRAACGELAQEIFSDQKDAWVDSIGKVATRPGIKE